MERGSISYTVSWGVGRIQPDDAEDTVVFTERVFNEDWSQAFEGRKVDFERYANGKEAKRVVGR